MPEVIEYTTCGNCGEICEHCVRQQMTDTRRQVVTIELCQWCLKDLAAMVTGDQ